MATPVRGGGTPILPTGAIDPSTGQLIPGGGTTSRQAAPSTTIPLPGSHTPVSPSGSLGTPVKRGTDVPSYWGNNPGTGTSAGRAVVPKFTGSIGQIQPTDFLPVVYGQQRVALEILWFTGSTSVHGYGLAVIGEGQISAVDHFFVCDAQIGNVSGTAPGSRNFTSYLGASGDTVPTDLWPGGSFDLSGWTAPRKPAYARFNFYGDSYGNEPWWSFIPALKSGSGTLTMAADVHGRLIYDPRLDSTNGGSGSQRYADPTTWAYSNNPALIYSDLHISFGKTPPASMNWTSIATAATICEAKGFTCNITFTNQSSLENALTSVLQTCCGLPTTTGGIGLWIDVANAAAPSLSVDEADGSIFGVAVQWLDTSTRPTQLIIAFNNATLRPAHPAWGGHSSPGGGGIAGWKPDTFNVDDPLLASGGVPLRSTTMQIPGISSQAQAQIVGDYYFNLAAISMRLRGTIAFQGVLLSRGMKIHVKTLKGIDADFLVEQADADASGMWPVVLRPYEEALYSSTPISVGPPVVIDGPDPFDTPPDVTGATEVDTSYITTQTPAQKVTTSYAGLTYGLPDYQWSKRLRVRAMVTWTEGDRDAATWASMAATEIIVPLTGNLPPVSDSVFALEMLGVVVGTDAFEYNSLGEVTDELVARQFSRIIVKLESQQGVLSDGVTLDGAALMSESNPPPPGQPAMVTQLLINAAPLPALSGPTQAIIVLDEADGKMKASIEASPFDELLKVLTAPTPAQLPYVDLPDQILGGAIQAWNAITYGAGLFVAVATGGGVQAVMTSPDGVTWTLRTTPDPSSPGWYDISWSGSLFVIVGLYAGQVLTSPDGITWTQRSAQTGAWSSVAYGAGLFVSLATYDAHSMTSTDGITWTKRTTPAASIWGSVIWNGTLFVAVGAGTSASNCVMTSPDGLTWTLRACPVKANWSAVAWSGSLFVAVEDFYSTGHRVMTSPDGITWTLRTTPADVPWVAVVYGAGLFVAVANNGQAMTSSDGITWTLRTGPATPLSALVYDGSGLFVALGTGWPTFDAYLSTSTDGISWTPRSGPGTGVSLAPANTLRIISSGGLLYASYDGGAYGPIGGALATKEVPTGAHDGTNVTFTMAEALAAGDLVFVDGILDPAAYGSGTTLTTSIPPGPGGGVLIARVTGSGSGGGGGSVTAAFQAWILADRGLATGSSFEWYRAPTGPTGLLQLAPQRTWTEAIADAKTYPPGGWAWQNTGVLTAADENVTTANGLYLSASNATTDWAATVHTAAFIGKAFPLVSPVLGQTFVARISSVCANSGAWFGVGFVDANDAGKNGRLLINNTSGSACQLYSDAVGSVGSFTAPMTTTDRSNGVWMMVTRIGRVLSIYYSLANQATPPTSWTFIAQHGAMLASEASGIQIGFVIGGGAVTKQASVLYWDDSFNGLIFPYWPASFGVLAATGYDSSSPTVTLVAGFDLGDPSATVADADVRLALADIVNPRQGDSATWTFSVVRGASTPVSPSTYQDAGSVTVSGAGRFISITAKCLSTGRTLAGSLDIKRFAIPFHP